MSYEGATYRHTDIHTYIQTYISTDRQTEPNYDIDIHENGLNWRAIKWSVHKKASPRPKGAKFCDVCLTEKLTLCDNIGKPGCLNFRRETGCKCPHKYKHLLAAVKTRE